MSRRLLLVLGTVALAGCAGLVRVAYNHGGYTLRLVANDYFKLTDEQADLFNVQFARLHTWHRREELPIYARVFDSAGDRTARGIERADVAWALAELRTRYRVVATHAAEQSAPVVAMFNADNIAALEKKYAKSNAKFTRDFLSGDRARRDRKRVQWLEERFEHFMGELTDAQRGLLEQFVRAQPSISEERLEHRKHRQQAFVQLLKQYPASPELGARLRDYLVHWEADYSPAHARRAREWEERLIALIVDMDRTMTAEQRSHVVQRFKSYAEDCRALARYGNRAADAGAFSASGLVRWGG